MAVGAYAAYNFQLRIEGIPILLSFILAVAVRQRWESWFGLPSLRYPKAFYLDGGNAGGAIFRGVGADQVFLVFE